MIKWWYITKIEGYFLTALYFGGIAVKNKIINKKFRTNYVIGKEEVQDETPPPIRKNTRRAKAFLKALL